MNRENNILILSFSKVLISISNLDKDLIYQSLYLLNNSILNLSYFENLEEKLNKNESFGSNQLPLFSTNILNNENIKFKGFGKMIKIDFKKKLFFILTPIPLSSMMNQQKINLLNFLKVDYSNYLLNNNDDDEYFKINKSLMNQEKGMKDYLTRKFVSTMRSKQELQNKKEK